ncbi:rhomboid family intramembrane serine protease [Granulicella sp. 5B5]|uniref:rhomboid family intramembrane serine protease n=1 Tax=Granulicella sp. 5B5 TaxID=1617967 RepID=UPI0015F49D84|nr:rhomboid family intramembrane serine protease [Granulicella sp. 5B5]QMV18573.1 rhomboid family intramembrane serine protease [Granulicella sp. 5B5]
MAFRSNGPVTLSLPPFRGVTRRIILTTLIAYFGLAVLGLVLPELAQRLHDLAVLVPDVLLHGAVWQLLSYPFVGDGLLSVGFALLSLWYFASSLEEELGGRWLMEYFLVTTIGGGLLGSLLAVALSSAGHPVWIPFAATAGLWPFVLASLIAFAYRGPEQVVNFNFIFHLKAKYLAAIYVLIYLALSLRGGDRFGAVVALLCGGVGYLFLLVAPRKGVRVGASEQWYGMRNAYYRWKRRRAAKKFTVYMRKQGKEVSLDEDGRYVDPMGERRDPNDKRWMN